MQRKYEKTRKSMIARHSTHWWDMVGVVGFRAKYRDKHPVTKVMLKLYYWWENLYADGQIKKKKEVKKQTNRRN